MIDGLSLLLPGLDGLVGLLRALLAGLTLWGLGRWAVPRAAPEIQLLSGWGVACLVLTLWGVALPGSLALPGWALVAAGALGLAVRRPAGAAWRAVGRVTLLAAPVLLLLAGARPVLLDSVTHWLPNAAYLVAQGQFPAAGRPVGASFFPAFPYDLQLVAFLSALGAERLPVGAVIHANLLLQLAMALLLARLAAGLEDRPDATPGWAACAAGLLACWWLNPGFGPEIAFSDYGDVATGVGVATAAWLALRRVRGVEPPSAALALVLAALINTKQADLVLVVAVVAAAGALALWEGRRGALPGLVLSILPALALYAAWRVHVATQLPGLENELMPVAQWRVAELPAILGRIARIWAEKVTFFGILAAALVAGIARWGRGARDDAAALLLILLGVFLLFDGFLVFIYVAHFQGVMSSNAQSYYRFNTQLALLLMTALVLLLREPVWSRLGGGRWRRALPALAVTVSLALPLGFFERVRFDLRRARHVTWTIAEQAAAALAPTDRLAILGTGADRAGVLELRAYLDLLAPRVAATALRDVGAEALPALAARGFDRALVTCAAAVDPGLPGDAAALLAWDGARWVVRASWRQATRPGALFGERRPGELLGCG